MSRGSKVLIVGGGLAGLRCAQVVVRHGHEAIVLEASDRPGGRVTSDEVDGFIIDRGFQLLNPAYPQARRSLDLAALQLCGFEPGALIVDDTRRTRLADPLRRPLSAPGALVAPLGTVKGRLALGMLLARLRFLGPGSALKGHDQPALAWLEARGIDEATATSLLEPFLTGVLLEEGLASSGHLVALLLSSFVRGVPGVPSRGMRAIPEQMTASLPAGTLRTGAPVGAVTAQGVTLLDGEELDASSVVVATDPTTAAHLLDLDRVATMRSVTTLWLSSPQPAGTGATLVLDATDSPVVNAVDMSAAAPSYAPPGRSLFALSLLGAEGRFDEGSVLARAGELLDVRASGLELIATSTITHALPAMLVPLDLAPVIDHDGVLVAGDHVAIPSIQGALASGERAARAVLDRR